MRKVSDTARLSRILAGSQSALSIVKKSSGEWMNSSQKSLKKLMIAHFPCNLEPQIVENMTNDVLVIKETSITKEKVACALNFFEPYKGAGPDGIFPAMFQECSTATIPWLSAMFKSCLKLGYVPKSWRRLKFIFIEGTTWPKISGQ